MSKSVIANNPFDLSVFTCHINLTNIRSPFTLIYGKFLSDYSSKNLSLKCKRRYSVNWLFYADLPREEIRHFSVTFQCKQDDLILKLFTI